MTGYDQCVTGDTARKSKMKTRSHGMVADEDTNRAGDLKRLKIIQGEAGGTPALQMDCSATATCGRLHPVDGGE